MQKNRGNLTKTEKSLFIVIISMLVLAYFLPPILVHGPVGTDSYSHIFYTKVMHESFSLQDFYETSVKNKYNEFDYPFGMWLFSSVTTRITGIDIYTLSYLLPPLIILISLAALYTFSAEFISQRKYRFFSLIFVLSMPLIAINLLSFSTYVFIMPVLLIILHNTLNDRTPLKKAIFINCILLFLICITHTGTYLFLMFLSLLFLFAHGTFWGKINIRSYLLVAGSLFIYAVSINIFPYIHPQYIDKSSLMIEIVGDFLATKLGLPALKELSSIFYNRIFLDRSLIDITLWSGFLYTLVKAVVISRGYVLKKIRHGSGILPVAIPFIGSITNISHSIVTTPFWIGPFHSLLSVPGALNISEKGKTLLITSLLLTVLPGSLSTGATGSLREIMYLFLIMPITSSIGLAWLEEQVQKSSRKTLKTAYKVFFYGMLIALVTMPIVGNIYYSPSISGSDNEKNGLFWLKDAGGQNDGITGFGYRNMINVYSDKPVPEVNTLPSGTETVDYRRDLKDIYFAPGWEKTVDELYSTLGIRYYLSSERVLKNIEFFFPDVQDKSLRIDENTELDKVYSNKDGFSVYGYVPQKYFEEKSKTKEGVVFMEAYPQITDAGSDLYIKASSYTAKLAKDSPTISYLGDDMKNFLGEGYLKEYVKLWPEKGYGGESAEYYADKIDYSVALRENQVIYSAILKNNNKSDNWATFIMTYTFYDRAIKNEIFIANDWISPGSGMNLYAATTGFIPFSSFMYEDWNGFRKEKTIYPSGDTIRITDEKYKSIYFTDGENGIYFSYGKTSPYPQNIIYQGSTSNAYSSIHLSGMGLIPPGKSTHMTRYIAVGDMTKAEQDIKRYDSVWLYPYMNATVPVILTGYIDALDKTTGEDMNYTLDAYAILKDENLADSYTEALGISENEVNTGFVSEALDYGVKIIGYGSSPEELAYYADKHYSMALSGFATEWLSHDLQTINESLKNNFSFIETAPVNVPSGEFNQEGLRHPEFASYRGNKTGLVILPVSYPAGFYLTQDNIEENIAAWKAVMNSVTEYDDMCMLLWKTQSIARPEYSDSFKDLIDYARYKNMSFISAGEAADRFRSMQNVSVTFSKGIDTALIAVKNSNTHRVNGVSVKVAMPAIGRECSYRAANGRTERIIKKGQECFFYISVDLAPGENRTVVIEPGIPREIFMVSVVKGQSMNSIVISVKNQRNESEALAAVSIDEKMYYTNGNGEIKASIKRGSHVIKVEKPGFETITYKYEARSRLYDMEMPPMALYGLIAVLLILPVYLFKKRRKRPPNLRTVTSEQV
jgi:hypothetical protein